MADLQYVDVTTVKTVLSVQGNLSPFASQASQISPRQNLGIPASVALLNNNSNYNFGTAYYNTYVCQQTSSGTRFNLPPVSTAASINDGAGVIVTCDLTFSPVAIYDNTFTNLITTINPGQTFLILAVGFSISATTGWRVVDLTDTTNPYNPQNASYMPSFSVISGITVGTFSLNAASYTTVNAVGGADNWVNIACNVLFQASSNASSMAFTIPFGGNFTNVNQSILTGAVCFDTPSTSNFPQVLRAPAVISSNTIRIDIVSIGAAPRQYQLSFGVSYQIQ